MNILHHLILCILTGMSFATWATCEPPQTEPSQYRPLQIKRRAEDYRPLVSLTRSRP